LLFLIFVIKKVCNFFICNKKQKIFFVIKNCFFNYKNIFLNEKIEIKYN